MLSYMCSALLQCEARADRVLHGVGDPAALQQLQQLLLLLLQLQQQQREIGGLYFLETTSASLLKLSNALFRGEMRAH